MVHSFSPIADPSARVLILGTMPGKASLAANQYYAHPRNCFWRIMGEVFGFDSSLAYGERVDILGSRGVAAWDVLRLCTRESSLDSDIDESSIVPNDFAPFFGRHQSIERICFNGAKAANLYRKHVQFELADTWRLIESIRLPSTSPANAGTPYPAKLRAWSAALGAESPGG